MLLQRSWFKKKKEILHFALKVLIIFNGCTGIMLPFIEKISRMIRKYFIEDITIEYMMTMTSTEKGYIEFTPNLKNYLRNFDLMSALYLSLQNI